MSELENNLNRIFEEHQHESGLHVIGGRRRLLDRLLQFIEDGVVPGRTGSDSGRHLQDDYQHY